MRSNQQIISTAATKKLKEPETALYSKFKPKEFLQI